MDRVKKMNPVISFIYNRNMGMELLNNLLEGLNEFNKNLT